MFTDVMVDIETTGTNYSRNAIIQISAVKFNFQTGEVSEDFFDHCLRIHPGREMDPKCWQEFWVKNKSVYDMIMSRAEDPHAVIDAFYRWLLKDWPARPEGLQFWSKPTSFDHPYLVNYFEMFGYEMPCHFRFCRDLNSFMAGLKGDQSHPDFEGQEPDFQGDQHNALHDVLHQIRLLFAMKGMTTQGFILPPLQEAAE